MRNEFALPKLPLGTGQITDVSVAMGIALQLSPLGVEFIAALGSSEKPFRWVVSPLAGTGVVQVGVNNDGLNVLVQGGLGLGLAIDLGIASGSAAITLALELNTAVDPFMLKAILSGRASVDVMQGLCSATITLAAGLGVIPPSLSSLPPLPPPFPPKLGPYTIGSVGFGRGRDPHFDLLGHRHRLGRLLAVPPGHHDARVARASADLRCAMPLADLKLSIFAFPQKWENGAIHLRALLVPTGSPLVPPLGMPKFAGREWQLRTVVLSGLNGFWSANPTGTAILPPVATVLTPPAGAEALFVALRDGLGISDAPPSAADQATRLTNLGNTRIRKQLPPSYTGAFAFERSRTEDAGVGDEFGCALRDVVGGLKEDQKPSDQVSWGRVIAYALRQPELAVALGLVYRDLQVPVGDISATQGGGWLYLELDPTIPGQIVPPPDAIRSYAARLPALDQAPRGLFGAVLFPVGQTSQAGYDEPWPRPPFMTMVLPRSCIRSSPIPPMRPAAGATSCARRPIAASTSDGTTSRS